MEYPHENSCSVIQYYKGSGVNTYNPIINHSNSLNTSDTVETNNKEVLTQNNGGMIEESTSKQTLNHDIQKGEDSMNFAVKNIKEEDIQIKKKPSEEEEMGFKGETTLENMTGVILEASQFENKLKIDPIEPVKVKVEAIEPINVKVEPIQTIELKTEPDIKNHTEMMESEDDLLKKGKKRMLSETGTDGETSNSFSEYVGTIEGSDDDDSDYDDDDEEEMENKPRKRGRGKKNPDIIPPHLSSDVVLGYKILLKFLETPQFSCFHKPFKRSGATENDDDKITCLDQIKKKFDTNSYKNVSDFVNDVREMLINIYESRNSVATKTALRLEQILEQRIAQLPNYLRPQCALILPPDEINSLNKIRISKGGGFVSLLLEKTEKERSEKYREKRKLLAEERKQLKEEQDKDVQEWEKNVLLKDVEEEIKSMWELPAIGQFIHLCSELLGVGEVAQYEIERMLLMPQCSDTLDLIMTSLLNNSLIRSKLDRTPSMPYSVWAPLVKTRVVSWYRHWQRENKDEQKVFEEIGVEPDFWQILGPDENPLDLISFHELSLFQRVWVLKTLCDVDFVKKKTVYDNIRAQPLDDLSPFYLGVDRHGNRYMQFKLFGEGDVRIYRQNVILDDDVRPSELIESSEGFEERTGLITSDKVFKDIWDLGDKQEVKPKRKKAKQKKERSFPKVVPIVGEQKNLRKSVRAKQKTYADWSDSDMSDTDLSTLRDKLKKNDPDSLYKPTSDKEFICLSIFRLSREKFNSKPAAKKSSTPAKKTEDKNEGATNDDKTVKPEPEDKKEDAKPGCENEQVDSAETKPNQESQNDCDKSSHGEDDGDSEEKDDKINDKTVVNKGDASGDEAPVVSSNAVEDTKPEKDVKDPQPDPTKDVKEVSSYKHSIPNHLKPDSSKFYLVVDSVEGLRQLISKFGSHENDLEIISRSTKAKGKRGRKSEADNRDTSCEISLLESLQKLLVEVEPLELDMIKSYRTNREKMYKEYMNFLNRPSDFVHPNEAFWMKDNEEPNNDGSGGKENGTNAGDPVDSSLSESLLNDLGPRKRTRVTRMQLKNDSDEDSDDTYDYESTGSDDNWVLPTPKKRARKEAAVATPTLRSSRFPRRNTPKRGKSSPSEKGETLWTVVEKSHSTPEKTKKALFWGQRNSDPSEDLNWETNRQKILEQHNSPVKKVFFGQKPEESNNDTSNSQNAFQKKSEIPTTSVITSLPTRYIPQSPASKKSYYGTAQPKAVDSQGKQQQKVSAGANSTKHATVSGSVIETASPDNVRSHTKKGQTPSKQQTAKAPQPIRPKKTIIGPENATLHQALAHSNQIKVQNSGQLTNVIQAVGSSGIKCGVIQQNPIGQAQILHPIGRIQQIQIQQPSGQTRTVAGTVTNLKIQQPIQWPPKLIALQTIDHTGKVIQPEQQQHHQVQNHGEAQIHSQGQLQQVFQIEPSKTNSDQPPVKISAKKLASIHQMIKNHEREWGTESKNKLYLSDGKNLIKLDSELVDEYLKDDKILALSDKLDLRKPLLIVKPTPKATNRDQTNTGETNSDQTNAVQAYTEETSTDETITDQPYTDQSYPDQTNIEQGLETISQSEPIPPTSQQNFLVISDPMCTVPNFVIPENYIIEDSSQVQGQGSETQTVKIGLPASTDGIQQKPIINEDSQPQIFKILTPQPVANNQNILLSSANLNIANQADCPVNQAILTGEQQAGPLTTLCFMRPVTVSSPGTPVENNASLGQSPIIVNDTLQIQGQRVEGPRPQATIVGGRILSTEVPNVRMATPSLVPSSSTPQTVRIVRNQTIQPIRIATAVQSRQSPNQVVNTQPAALATVITAQPLRLATSLQGQAIVSTETLNPQAVASMNIVQAMPSNNHQLLTHTVVSSANILPNNTVPKTILTSQPLTTSLLVHPISTSTSFVSGAGELEPDKIAHPVRNITNSQPESVLVSSAQPLRVVTIAQPQQIYTSPIISSTNPISYVQQPARAPISTIVQAVRPAMSTIVQPPRPTIVQPVRLAAGVRPQTFKLVHNNNPGIRFVNLNASCTKAAVITNSVASPIIAPSMNSQPTQVVSQSIRVQTIMKPSGVPPGGGLHSG